MPEHEPPLCKKCGKPLKRIVEVAESSTSFWYNPEKKTWKRGKPHYSEATRFCGECWEGLDAEQDDYFLDRVEEDESPNCGG